MHGAVNINIYEYFGECRFDEIEMIELGVDLWLFFIFHVVDMLS